MRAARVTDPTTRVFILVAVAAAEVGSGLISADRRSSAVLDWLI